MAYTVFGGDILPIEATLFKGSGNLILTGSLGEVMQESCHIALDYIKSNMDKFNIDNKILLENDVHIHVPEGAVNKDGPSAGVTITSALISLLLNKKVSRDVAMTGEITLRGRVLPIGGLKEKLLAAKTAAITTVLVPKRNEKDVAEISSEIKTGMEIVFVETMEEVVTLAFATKPKKGLMRSKSKSKKDNETATPQNMEK